MMDRLTIRKRSASIRGCNSAAKPYMRGYIHGTLSIKHGSPTPTASNSPRQRIRAECDSAGNEAIIPFSPANAADLYRRPNRSWSDHAQPRSDGGEAWPLSFGGDPFIQSANLSWIAVTG